MINFGEAEAHYGAADGFVLGGGVGVVEDATGIPPNFADMGPFLGLLLEISAACNGCPDGADCVGWKQPVGANLLVGWAGLAVLVGQGAAVLESLPVDVRDQAASLQREAGQRIRVALS
jgi:hypothetical protein